MRCNPTVVLMWLLIVGGLSGCSTVGNQVLVFGTDTKVALDVSGDPTGQPSFTFGYKRREAVWLPLAARRSFTHRCMVGSDGKATCTATDQPLLATHVCVVPPDNTTSNATVEGKSMLCLTSWDLTAKFVGKKGNQEDAYSVMASFGLDSSGSNAKIAQYFATGFAARALAEQGGAALVSSEAVSPSAAKIQEQEQSDIDLIIARVTDNGAFKKEKFDELVDKTAMGSARKDQLKADTKDSKTLGQIREILRSPRYSPFLGQLIDAM